VKVFFDTNVLISAFIGRGFCADLFRIVISEYELILGEYVIQEFKEKLEKKFKFPQKEIYEMTSFLEQFEIIPIPDSPYKIDCPDKDDCWVIASAMRGKAKYLITGDNHLLDLPRIMKLKIMSPRNFYDAHNKRKIK